MSEKAYWWEAETFAYYRVPKALFTNLHYIELSTGPLYFMDCCLTAPVCPAEMRQRFPMKAGIYSSITR